MMNLHNVDQLIGYFLLIFLIVGCNTSNINDDCDIHKQTANLLDYTANPESKNDRSSLAFSDNGAWFAYGFHELNDSVCGFAGPFLMTQENGIWCSSKLIGLELTNATSQAILILDSELQEQNSYNSHLEQVFKNDLVDVKQSLFFSSSTTATITTTIINNSNKKLILKPLWKGYVYENTVELRRGLNSVEITSNKTSAIGYISPLNENEVKNINVLDSSYVIEMKDLTIGPSMQKEFIISQSFEFIDDDLGGKETIVHSEVLKKGASLEAKIVEKDDEIYKLHSIMDSSWQKSQYYDLLSKAMLTLQNNWRAPAGELKHSGIFPSYHYRWFHGFWAWDSWKYSVALAYYRPELAKDQIRAMFDYMDEEGFIADCIYRDTTIENHNYRNTKPPLSSWAVWSIFQQDLDTTFLVEMYPKLIKQHNWWYLNRDHDKDSICEYGSTDGTLVAAKWESGMDNAVRFDNSKLLRNSETAFSLDQESVDLNSYLYAEKILLAKIAQKLNYYTDSKAYKNQAKLLKSKISAQFFDKDKGWFFDTSIDGKTKISVMGCEGWIPLWANVASKQEAEAIVSNIMDTNQFNTRVPLQTLSASHADFKPNGGYWRGPTWLDQAYFGVVGMKNYGYYDEAQTITYKLLHNAEGVLEKGSPIRENYNPITGEGLEAQNFSWSAAHYILLLINE